MPPTLLQIIVLALIQGAAELLPVSSSAHVIVAEKLMRINPSSPEMTFMLVMLHTGTMFAVIVYFWRAWRESFFSSGAPRRATLGSLVVATFITLVIGFALKVLIEKVFVGENSTPLEVEDLFSRLPLVAAGLLAVGVLIIAAGRRSAREEPHEIAVLPLNVVGWMGTIQGLTLPLRGFSRSGATISAGLLLDMPKRRTEEFSFALAVLLTPVVIAYELHRLMKAHAGSHLSPLVVPGLVGMACSFLAGLLALKLLSRLLEGGRWWFFGVYCLAAAAVVAGLAAAGY